MTKRFEQWSRWAGQFDDVLEAGRLAVASIRKHRTGKEPPLEIEVTYPRLVRSHATMAELEGGTDIRDLTLITSLRIRVGEEADLSVSIHAESKSPAMSLEVVGDDEDEVNAVFDTVITPLERGRRLLSDRGVPILAVPLAMALALVALAALDSQGLIELDENQPGPRFGEILVIGVVAGAIALALVTVWLNPPLQLLSPDGRTRLRRFRAGVVAIALSLLGLGVQALVSVIK